MRNGCVKVWCETGGIEGGSCWDDSDPQPYDTDNSVELSDLISYLEFILENTCDTRLP